MPNQSQADRPAPLPGSWLLQAVAEADARRRAAWRAAQATFEPHGPPSPQYQGAQPEWRAAHLLWWQAWETAWRQVYRWR
jgi:hypothetical protein